MPNPLPRSGHFTTGFGPGVIVRACPELALQVVDVLSYHVSAEAQIGDTLSGLFHGGRFGEWKLIEDFIQLRSLTSQRKQLLLAAEQRLTPSRYAELKVLLTMFRTAQKYRNPLVHWVSGYSPEIPDAVLFANPHHQLRATVDLSQYLHASRRNLEQALGSNTWPPEPAPEPNHEYERRNIRVYQQRDFDVIRDCVSQVLQGFHIFNFLMHGSGERPIDERESHRLHSLPHFRQRWLQDRARPGPP